MPLVDIAPHLPSGWIGAGPWTNPAAPGFSTNASQSFAPLYAFCNFDGSVALPYNYWQSYPYATAWVSMDFGVGAAYSPVQYAIKTISSNGAEPKNFTFEGSNDAFATFDVLDTRTNEINWTSEETRTYTCVSSIPYRYFRINISSSNDPLHQHILMGEFYLYINTDKTISAANSPIGIKVSLQANIINSSPVQAVPINLSISLSANFSITYSVSLIRNPRLRFFDGSGLPLAGGLLYLCPAGSSNISVTKASWQDYEKTILNPNPIVLDSEGYCTPIFSDVQYKIFLYSSTGALISSQDNIWNTTLGLLQTAAAQLQFWDKNGSPLVGGKLYTCIPGAATLNQLKASYSNPAQTVLNANPIILNSSGKASLIYTRDFYKLFLFDASDVAILSQDDVGPSGIIPL